MLKKLKLTKFAAVLCLFGFFLVPAAPAWADIYSQVKEMKRCNEILDNFGKTSVKRGQAGLGRDCYKQVADTFPGINVAARSESIKCSEIKDTFGDIGKKLRFARSGRECFKKVAHELTQGLVTAHFGCAGVVRVGKEDQSDIDAIPAVCSKNKSRCFSTGYIRKTYC